MSVSYIREKDIAGHAYSAFLSKFDKTEPSAMHNFSSNQNVSHTTSLVALAGSINHTALSMIRTV